MRLNKRLLIRSLVAGAIIAAGLFALVPKTANANTVFDCNSNAVLYCGAPSVSSLITKYDNYGDPTHHYTDLHNVYNFFGITSAGIHSLATKVAIGQVHKDGTVWLNGQEIGMGALTAGRTDLPGSVPVPGTGVFERAPSTSFNSESLDAYIGFENGVPEWGVLISCGNPVKFNHRQLTISKQVESPVTGAYGEDATFPNGARIRYRITVTNPGVITDTNVKVADAIPAGLVYDKGTTTLNDKPVGDGIYSLGGINIGSLAPHASAQVTFLASADLPASKCGLTEVINTGIAATDYVVAIKDTAATHINVVCTGQCTSLTASGYDVEAGKQLTFTAAATTQGITVKDYIFKVDGQTVQTSSSPTYTFMSNDVGTHSVAVVVLFSNNTQSGGTGNCLKQVTVTPPPATISCDQLTASQDVVAPDEEITFTAKATYTNANLISFIFKVNGQEVQSTTSNQYVFKESQEGTYTVSVTVHTDKGDATSNACVKKVNVQKVPQPIEQCDLLTVTPTSITAGRAVTATTSFTAKNGATFKQANFTFGDEASPAGVTVINQLDQNGNAVATHVYNQPGDYTVTVTLDFTVNGKEVDGVTDPNTCVAKVNVGAVLGTTTPTPPAPTLINTGPGPVIGLFSVVSILGAFLHRRWTLHRG